MPDRDDSQTPTPPPDREGRPYKAPPGECATCDDFRARGFHYHPDHFAHPNHRAHCSCAACW